jgi:phosphoserine phosphatase
VKPHVKHPSSSLLKLWQSADAVCFDVDSTVAMDEGTVSLSLFNYYFTFD